MHNISIVTYTHSNVKDVWPMFCGQIIENIPFIKNRYMFNDKPYQIEGFDFISYEDPGPYWQQYCSCLEQVQEDFIITFNEDQIIYDTVQEKDMLIYIDFLNDSQYSFLRLIKSGIDREIHIQDDIFEVPQESKYLFAMQPTIWKRKDLLEVVGTAKISNIFHEPVISDTLRNQLKKGSYIYNDESKAGRSHYWSSKFPVMEVIAKGKWLMSESGDKLPPLLKKYEIDPNIRGLQ